MDHHHVLEFIEEDLKDFHPTDDRIYPMLEKDFKDGVMICREGTPQEIIYIWTGISILFAYRRDSERERCQLGKINYYNPNSFIFGFITEDDGNLYLPEFAEKLNTYGSDGWLESMIDSLTTLKKIIENPTIERK